MSGSSRRVLVVDDEEMIRNVVVRIMKIKSHQPLEAETGQAAMDILEAGEAVDYAIIDLNMPGSVSGEELTSHIIENYPDTTVIISSGFVDPETRKRLEELGVSAILEKPYKMDDVLSLID